MALSIAITLNNGVVASYHVITGCNTDWINNTQTFTLQSYVNQSAFNENPANSLDGLGFQMAGTTNSTQDAENWLINNTSFDTYSTATIVS